MLARLAVTLGQRGQRGQRRAGIPPAELGEEATIVIDDNCTVSATLC